MKTKTKTKTETATERDAWAVTLRASRVATREVVKCDRCEIALSARVAALGWPVLHSGQHICPECHGAKAFCRDCGDVLCADDDASCCLDCEV